MQCVLFRRPACVPPLTSPDVSLSSLSLSLQPSRSGRSSCPSAPPPTPSTRTCVPASTATPTATPSSRAPCHKRRPPPPSPPTPTPSRATRESGPEPGSSDHDTFGSHGLKSTSYSCTPIVCVWCVGECGVLTEY